MVVLFSEKIQSEWWKIVSRSVSTLLGTGFSKSKFKDKIKVKILRNREDTLV